MKEITRKRQSKDEGKKKELGKMPREENSEAQREQDDINKKK